jgi:DDE_Tnp_1-associated
LFIGSSYLFVASLAMLGWPADRGVAFRICLTSDSLLPGSKQIDSTRWPEKLSSEATLEEFGACWEGLEDPRTGNATLHHLHDLLMIALCSVICGGENAMDMAAQDRKLDRSMSHIERYRSLRL